MPQAGRPVGPPPARPDGPPSGPMPVNSGPPPAPQAPPRPPEPQPEPPRPPEQRRPAPARAPKLAQRADGGFGPMGSSGTWGGSSSSRAGYGRNMTWSADDFKEERREDDDLRAGGGYKPGESGRGAVPQFLVEADELFEEDDGESRLVAPPVLGEAPSSYRDF